MNVCERARSARTETHSHTDAHKIQLQYTYIVLMTKSTRESEKEMPIANGIPNEHKHLFTDHERNNTHDSEDDTSS